MPALKGICIVLDAYVYMGLREEEIEGGDK